MSDNIELNISAIQSSIAAAQSRINANKASLLKQYNVAKESFSVSEGDMAGAVRKVLEEECGLSDKMLQALNTLCASIQSATGEMSSVDNQMGAKINGSRD